MDANQTRIADAKRRIKEAGNDLAILAAIDSELAAIGGVDARGLRFIIGSRKLEIKKETSAVSVKSFLARSGLTAPDERALFKYPLDDETFERLKDLLKRAGTHGFTTVGWEVSALFVLWCAHWFQRRYSGGHRRWQDIAEALQVDFLDNDARRLTQVGLEIWRRKVRGDSSRQWLMTLAVEGGFPAGILEEADRWLTRYLSRVVGTLLASESVEPALAFAAAQKESNYAATAYRQDIFYALAADLAATIVHFRRKADVDKPRGVSASEWLDATQPGWRKNLPIATSIEAAARLVDGLMESEASNLLGDKDVGCNRLLQNRGGIWRPAIQLSADGIANGGILKELKGRSERIRAFPASAFAKYTSGEHAIFEPPSASGDGWRVRPSRRDTVISGMPFNVPASIEFRCDGSPIGHSTWPHGTAVHSEIGIFATDLLGPNPGATLTLIGTGSGVFKPTVVYVVIPETWSVTADTDVTEFDLLAEPCEDKRRLWRVKGIAIIRSPEDDRYRVESDSTSSSRSELVLDGVAPAGLDSDEPDVELFAGAPTCRVFDAGHHRELRRDEIRWRADGERPWKQFPISYGRVEIAWIDPQTNFIRDRRRLLILQSGAQLDSRRLANGMSYTPVGFPVDTLKAAGNNLALEIRDATIFAQFDQDPARRARFILSSKNARPLNVSAPFLLGSGIAKWSGVRVSGGKTGSTAAKISLTELAELVAFADGRQSLYAGLLGRQRRRLERSTQRWDFVDELPMRAIADELFSMLSPFADNDVYAELALQDGTEYWHVQQFEMTLVFRIGQLRIIEGFSRNNAVELFGRPVDAPWEEKQLATWSPSEQMEQRLPQMPEGLVGTWIVYGRRNDAVVSRPIVMVFGETENDEVGLSGAARIADITSRSTAIEARFQDIAHGAPGADDDVAWLLKLCANLHGLPPASFDALQALPTHPCVAARVALRASNEEMRAVLSIANGLPFAWFLISADTWKEAAELERQACWASLSVTLGDQAATDWSNRSIEDAVKALAELDPLLSWPLMAATGVAAKSMPTRRLLNDAAQDHIRRYGDQIDRAASAESSFRSAFPGDMPTEFSRFDPTHLESLDAPCAAALAAAGKRTLDFAQVRQVKSAARSDSVYFAEAFDARFVQLRNR
jgi:hypothetical protein